MESTRKPDKIQGILIRLFIILTLFFPVVYSPLSYEDGGEYFVMISLPYLVLGIFLLWAIWNNRNRKYDRADRKFFWFLLGILLIYNLFSFYYNIRYLHWYGEQLNNTVAIAFFACLVRFRFFDGEEGKRLLQFLMASIVISNLCSIVYFFLGYTSFVICNNHVAFYRLPEDYYEFRHYWLYSHKSDYALQLILFLALFLRFKNLFNKKWMWWGSVFVLLLALGLTHSWTSVASAVCVFAGAFLDGIDWKKFTWKKWYAAGIAGVGILGCLLVGMLAKERNLGNFGARPYIWHGAYRVIKAYPMGLGFQFGGYPIEAVGQGWATNNAHNVLLNALLRFSVPVGVCFCILLLVIMGYCIIKSRGKWLALGTWGAAMLLLNIDYSLLNYEMAMFLFVMYCVCLYPVENPELAEKHAG